MKLNGGGKTVRYKKEYRFSDSRHQVTYRKEEKRQKTEYEERKKSNTPVC